MSYPIAREPQVKIALDEFLKQLGWNILDMQYSLSEVEPLSDEDQQEFDTRLNELVALQRTCIAFKQTLWDGVIIDEITALPFST